MSKRMKLLVLCFFTIVLSFFSFTEIIFANLEVFYEGAELLGPLDNLDVKTDSGNTVLDFIKNVISGEFLPSFATMQEVLLEMMIGEFQTQATLLLEMLLVVILSGILRQLGDSFSGKSVSDMGFFICYMVLIVVIITAFYDITSRVVEIGGLLTSSFVGMLPVLFAMSLSNGNALQTALISPTIMAVSGFISYALNTFLIPLILLLMSLELVNHISEKPMLSEFTALFRSGISWILKGAAMAFVGILSLQKIGGGVINGVAVESAKIAVRAVPIVGDVIGGAVDSALAVATGLRSATLVGVVLFLVLLCIPILVKLVVIYFVFKITAAVAEFICEERLVDAISGAGDYIGLLLSTIFLMEGIFLFSVVLLLVQF
ncbi:MAG: stage III sporulation protein AE [Bacillota bacterium]